MKILLRIKNWQIFFLQFLLPIVLIFIMGMFANFMPGFNFIFICLVISMLISIFSYFIWFYILGISLYKMLPADVPMKINLFKGFMIFVFTYVCVFIIAFAYVFINIENNSDYDSVFFIILPMHIFSMFCMIYCSYFVAKSLKAVKIQEPVKLGNYIEELLLLWFYPVGIWMLQPQINKIFEKHSTISEI